MSFLERVAWYAAHVIEHHPDMGRQVPSLQRLDWTGLAAQSLDELRAARPRPSPRMLDLWARDDRRARWKTIGRRPTATTPLGGYNVMSLRRDGSRLAALARS